MDIGRKVEEGDRRIDIPAIPRPERVPERERELVPVEPRREPQRAPLKEREFYEDDWVR